MALLLPLFSIPSVVADDTGAAVAFRFRPALLAADDDDDEDEEEDDGDGGNPFRFGRLIRPLLVVLPADAADDAAPSPSLASSFPPPPASSSPFEVAAAVPAAAVDEAEEEDEGDGAAAAEAAADGDKLFAFDDDDGDDFAFPAFRFGDRSFPPPLLCLRWRSLCFICLTFWLISSAVTPLCLAFTSSISMRACSGSFGLAIERNDAFTFPVFALSSLLSFWKYFWACVRVCTTVRVLIISAIFFHSFPCLG